MDTLSHITLVPEIESRDGSENKYNNNNNNNNKTGPNSSNRIENSTNCNCDCNVFVSIHCLCLQLHRVKQFWLQHRHDTNTPNTYKYNTGHLDGFHNNKWPKTAITMY